MENRIKIIAICGSPHRGNTYEALTMLAQSNPEIDFRILMLADYNLKNCVGCYSCINNGEENCPLKDDRDVLIEEMKSADATIFASPTYARMVSSLMKKFIERTSYIAHRPIFFGKYAMSLITCAGFGADMTNKYLSENFAQCGFKFVSSVELKIATHSETEKSNNEKESVKAYEKLIQAIKAKEKIEPSFGQLVYFNIFKAISVMNKTKGWADYSFYKDKEDYYFDTDIPYLKNVFAKWIAGREVKKIKANR